MFFVFFKKKKKNTIPFESNQNCYKNSNDCGIQNSDVLKKKKNKARSSLQVLCISESYKWEKNVLAFKFKR